MLKISIHSLLFPLINMYTLQKSVKNTNSVRGLIKKGGHLVVTIKGHVRVTFRNKYITILNLLLWQQQKYFFMEIKFKHGVCLIEATKFIVLLCDGYISTEILRKS